MSIDALRAGWSDRYTIERELGAGGMTAAADRRTGGPADGDPDG